MNLRCNRSNSGLGASANADVLLHEFSVKKRNDIPLHYYLHCEKHIRVPWKQTKKHLWLISA